MKGTRGTNSIVVLGALACLALSPVCAQQENGKKSFSFRGKVEAVDKTAMPRTVTNEPIEGWMGTMTMSYTVDTESVLNGVKAGDQITGKIHEGDLSLYDVQVIAQANGVAQASRGQSAGMQLQDLDQMALANN